MKYHIGQKVKVVKDLSKTDSSSIPEHVLNNTYAIVDILKEDEFPYQLEISEINVLGFKEDELEG